MPFDGPRAPFAEVTEWVEGGKCYAGADHPKDTICPHDLTREAQSFTSIHICLVRWKLVPNKGQKAHQEVKLAPGSEGDGRMLLLDEIQETHLDHETGEENIWQRVEEKQNSTTADWNNPVFNLMALKSKNEESKSHSVISQDYCHSQLNRKRLGPFSKRVRALHSTESHEQVAEGKVNSSAVQIQSFVLHRRRMFHLWLTCQCSLSFAKQNKTEDAKGWALTKQNILRAKQTITLGWVHLGANEVDGKRN